MSIKSAVVILVASLIVGGAIVVASLVLAAGAEPADLEPSDASRSSRTGPWVTDVESALKNAATAQESFATSSGGLYTAEIIELEEEGFQPTENVTISVIQVSDLGYCLEGAHARLSTVWHYSSSEGSPLEGAC